MQSANYPFISILLPTRNRSHIVAKAVASVLNQTFENWELIIIDNNASNQTRNNIERYICDTRVRYYKTGNLSMHDNWEYGLNKVRGEYFTVLEDKAELYEKALEIIHYFSHKHHFPESIVWNYLWGEKTFQEVNKDEIKSFKISTDEILEYFLSEDQTDINSILPKIIFSCYKTSSITKNIKKNGQFFEKYLPDYTSMFSQLANTSEILLIEHPLIYFNSGESNGEKFYLKNLSSNDAKDFISLSSGNDITLFYKDSVSQIPSINNFIMSDFMRIRHKVGQGRLANHVPNKINIYRESLKQIYYAEKLNVDMSEERAILQHELSENPTFIKNILKKYEEQLYYPKGPMDYMENFFLSLIEGIINKGLQVAFWGAGEITEYIFKSSRIICNGIKIVVDSNISKIGSTLPESGHIIRDASDLEDLQVDIIIIATQKWESEVRNRIREMGINSKVISPSNLNEFLDLINS